MSDNLQDDPGEAGPSGQRMTRLRARGGVPTKPPIIDEDDEDIFTSNRKRKLPKLPKEKVEREPKTPRVRKEREVIEKEPLEERIIREREITTDENSLFWVLRYSKNTITVSVLIIFKIQFIHEFNAISRHLLTSGLKIIKPIETQL